MALCLECEVGAVSRKIVLTGTSQNCLKRGNNPSVELCIGRLCQPKTRNPAWHCVPIWSSGGHRVVCVGNGNDLGDQRNFVPVQPVWVPIPVNPFMVVADDPGNLGVVLYVRENPFSDDRMFLHSPAFL